MDGDDDDDSEEQGADVARRRAPSESSAVKPAPTADVKEQVLLSLFLFGLELILMRSLPAFALGHCGDLSSVEGSRSVAPAQTKPGDESDCRAGLGEICFIGLHSYEACSSDRHAQSTAFFSDYFHRGNDVKRCFDRAMPSQ